MITYFYRNKNVGFSIGKVFKTISNEIKCISNDVIEIFMPATGANPLELLKNGIYSYKHRNKRGVNHITGSEHYLALFLPSRNTVVTVHDIMYLNYLSGIKRYLWKLLYIKSLKFAGYVTFISEEAKKTTLEHVSLHSDKITVIPNPVSADFKPSFKEFNSLKPVILHIGTLERKNLSRTIKALKGISCHLRIIGRLDQILIQLLELNHIEYSNGTMLSDSEIVAEYQQCDIVNFPSVLEGFGMPIIEGQASGRIVITSNISPMKEVADDGAVLVNPYDVESIKNGYLTIIHNEQKRNEIIKKGFINANRFQVSEVVKQYQAIYDSILFNKNEL